MHIDIVAIGNSKGVRIPKALLEQCGFGEHAEMRVDDGKLILSPIKKPRAGWADAFKDGDEELFNSDFANEFDETEWTW